MFLVFFIIAVIIIGATIFGYKNLISRIVKFLKVEITKKVKFWILLGSIVLSLLTANAMSMYGLFLLHFIIFTYIFELIYMLVKKIIKKDFLKFEVVRIFCIIPFILTFIYFIYGYYNIHNIVETKYIIETSKNIKENYKIVLLADIHYGTTLKEQALKNVIQKIDKINPDIVILGGDIVDENTTKDDMKKIFELLGNINSKYGIYYVYGNHDKQNYISHKKYTVSELKSEITKNNIILLSDEKKIINDNIVIYGREDISNKRIDLMKYIDIEANKSRFAITIDHQPLDYEINSNNYIDLIVSGHTHAGQIIPIKYFIDIFKTAELSYGYKKIGNLNAIVTSGLSGWGYPIRTSKNSEYVVIDIINNNL